VRRLLFALLLSLGALPPAVAQTDINALLNETQRVRREGNRVQLVWWIPDEYWEASTKGEAAANPQQLRNLLKLVDGYMIFAAVDAELDARLSLRSRPPAELIAGFQVLLGDGTRLQPVPEAQLTPELRTFFKIMRPLIAGMLGQLGQGLEFIALPGRQAGGARVADPLREGRFTVMLEQAKFEWRLPLGSLLPPVYDGKTGEQFQGDYRFNPYTGDALKPQRPAAR
jgi:hypothetical protein